MKMSMKQVISALLVAGSLGVATVANEDDASADKLPGVYKVDRVVYSKGKWYVVSNQLGIKPIDGHNYIPVGPLTKTNASGKKTGNQVLVKGNYFTFSGKNFTATYRDAGTIALKMDGKNVWLKRSGIKAAPKPKAKPKPKPKKPVAPKKKYVAPKPKPKAPKKPAPLAKPKAVNVRAQGTLGFQRGGHSYPAFQCTGFVAQILASRGVPEYKIQFLGNGNMWANSARARGLRVNMTPRVGSVVSFHAKGMYGRAGHVAYITKVNANGTFKIAEGNFNGKAYNERTIRVDHHVAGIIHF